MNRQDAKNAKKKKIRGVEEEDKRGCRSGFDMNSP
jgi:hypothetical protein